MRFVRVAVVACALLAAVGFGTPAQADVGFTVDTTSMDHVVAYTAPQDLQQGYRVSGSGLDQDFHLHIETTAPGLRLTEPMQGSIYSCTENTVSIDCDVSGLNSATALFEIRYSHNDLDRGIGTSGTVTYTTTATLSKPRGGGTLSTITSYLHVHASADVAIGGIIIEGLGNGQGFHLIVNRLNRGPSGSPTTTMVVTGFATTPTGLPSGCKASGTTVTCVYHAAPNVEDSDSVTIPLTAVEGGCRYTAHITGYFPDPKPSNNTGSKYSAGLGCVGAGAAPVTTPTAGSKPTTGAPHAQPTSAATTTGSTAPAEPTGSPTTIAATPGDDAAAALPGISVDSITATPVAQKTTNVGNGYAVYVLTAAAAALVLVGGGAVLVYRRRARQPQL